MKDGPVRKPAPDHVVLLRKVSEGMMRHLVLRLFPHAATLGSQLVKVPDLVVGKFLRIGAVTGRGRGLRLAVARAG